MTTATAVDLSPLWEYLDGLSDMDIPSDLTEIDAPWAYRRLESCDSECVQELLEYLTFDILEEFAYGLREAWHIARCEILERCRWTYPSYG